MEPSSSRDAGAAPDTAAPGHDDAPQSRPLAPARSLTDPRPDDPVATRIERRHQELLCRIAHDLRGPLNSISGWVHVLQGGQLDPARRRHAIEAIIQGVRAQSALLDDLQNGARAMRDRPPPARTDS